MSLPNRRTLVHIDFSSFFWTDMLRPLVLYNRFSDSSLRISNNQTFNKEYYLKKSLENSEIVVSTKAFVFEQSIYIFECRGRNAALYNRIWKAQAELVGVPYDLSNLVINEMVISAALDVSSRTSLQRRKTHKFRMSYTTQSCVCVDVCVVENNKIKYTFEVFVV